MARRGDKETGGGRISLHEVSVFRTLTTNAWRTSAEIAVMTGVSRRTSRTHIRKMAADGIAECQRLSPAYQYRLAARQPATEYAKRLFEAAEAIENTG